MISQFFRRVARWLYGCYAWSILILTVIPVVLLLCITPGLMRRRRIVRAAARFVARLAGADIRLRGWTIPERWPCVVVANHASYLDGIVLAAALPARFAFLIKAEMARVPVAGFLLRRIASEFVDRKSPQDRHRVARRLVETAQRGWMLAVFPEGTFDDHPGLRPFHPGAFTAAWRSGLPVVPVVISGARSKLPGSTLLPVPGPLSVRICNPIEPRQYASKDDLILATRAAILAHLDEPDLANPSGAAPDPGTQPRP